MSSPFAALLGAATSFAALYFYPELNDVAAAGGQRPQHAVTSDEHRSVTTEETRDNEKEVVGDAPGEHGTPLRAITCIHSEEYDENSKASSVSGSTSNLTSSLTDGSGTAAATTVGIIANGKASHRSKKKKRVKVCLERNVFVSPDKDDLPPRKSLLSKGAAAAAVNSNDDKSDAVPVVAVTTAADVSIGSDEARRQHLVVSNNAPSPRDATTTTMTTTVEEATQENTSASSSSSNTTGSHSDANGWRERIFDAIKSGRSTEFIAQTVRECFVEDATAKKEEAETKRWEAFSRRVLLPPTTTTTTTTTTTSQQQQQQGDSASFSPILHLCAEHLTKSNEDVLDFLIRTARVPIGFKDSTNGNMTALQLACVVGKNAVACKLMQLSKEFASSISNDEDKENGINAGNRDQWTALHFAAARNRAELVEELAIRCGADINAANAHKSTPLMLAITSRSVEASLALLNSCSSSQRLSTTTTSIDDIITSQDEKGATCLHLCMLGGFTMFAVAQELIHKGGRETGGEEDGEHKKSRIVNARDMEGQTPLYWGVHRGQGRMSALMLTHGADPTICSFPAAAAVSSPSPSSPPPSPSRAGGSACGASPLHLSVVARDEGMMHTYLLNAYACGMNPLDLCSCCDQEGRSVLSTAAACGQDKIVDLLLEALAADDENGNFSSGEEKDDAVVRLVCSAKDKRGKTALAHAVLRGHAKTAALLLKFVKSHGIPQVVKQQKKGQQEGATTEEGSETAKSQLVEDFITDQLLLAPPEQQQQQQTTTTTTPSKVNLFVSAVQQGMHFVASQMVELCADVVVGQPTTSVGDQEEEEGAVASSPLIAAPSRLLSEVLCQRDDTTGLFPVHLVAIHGNTNLLNEFLEVTSTTTTPSLRPHFLSRADGSWPIHHAARCAKLDAVESLFLHELQEHNKKKEANKKRSEEEQEKTMQENDEGGVKSPSPPPPHQNGGNGENGGKASGGKGRKRRSKSKNNQGGDENAVPSSSPLFSSPFSPSHSRSRNGDDEESQHETEKLLWNSEMVDDQGRTALHWCIKGMVQVWLDRLEGDAASHALLQYATPATSSSSFQQQPFHLASIFSSPSCRHHRVLQFAVSHGADLKQLDKQGHTCADYVRKDALQFAHYMQQAEKQLQEKVEKEEGEQQRLQGEQEQQEQQQDEQVGRRNKSKKKHHQNRSGGSKQQQQRDEKYYVDSILEQVCEYEEQLLSSSAAATTEKNNSGGAFCCEREGLEEREEDDGAAAAAAANNNDNGGAFGRRKNVVLGEGFKAFAD